MIWSKIRINTCTKTHVPVFICTYICILWGETERESDSRGKTRRLEWGESRGRGWIREKEAPKGMGGEKVREKSRSSQPFLLFLFLFLVHKGTKCLQPPQPLVVEGWEMGRPNPSPWGVPSFPSNRRQVSTAGWTAPWPGWASCSLLDPSVRYWVWTPQSHPRFLSFRQLFAAGLGTD